MDNMNVMDNDMNGGGSHGAEGASYGRCPIVEQHGPGHTPATARPGWTKDMKKAVIKYQCILVHIFLTSLKSLDVARSSNICL